MHASTDASLLHDNDATTLSSSPYAKRKGILVDMSSHVGMRGLLTAWIVVYHSVWYSDIGYINVQGSAWMTMFFLLSGFSLGVIYLDKCTTGENWSQFRRQFYQNRLARILPTFYFCNCIAIPLLWLGWGDLPQSALVMGIVWTVLPVYTWHAFQLGSAFDGPGWTVSCLLFMYLCFPLLGLYIRDTKKPKTWLSFGFFSQLLLCVGVLMTTGSFTLASMVPYSRLGIFVMGMVAARDCKKFEEREAGFRSLLQPRWCACCCRRRFKGKVAMNAIEGGGADSGDGVDRPGEEGSGEGQHSGSAGRREEHHSAEEWAHYSDHLALVLLLLFLWYTVVDSLDGRYGLLGSPGAIFVLGPVASGAVYLQCLVGVIPMTAILVSLTRDGGRSTAASVLRSDVLLWFGRHGMAIYLVHQVLISYFAVVYRIYVRGQSFDTIVSYVDTGPWVAAPSDATVRAKPNHELSLEEQRLAGNAMPGWGVLVILPCSCMLGYLITKLIDEPCTRYLRATKRS